MEMLNTNASDGISDWQQRTQEAVTHGLKQTRNQINALDREISRLLAKRFAAVDQVAQFKKQAHLPVLNPAREQQVLAAVTAEVDRELIPHVQSIFNSIMTESRHYQEAIKQRKDGNNA